jgi:hypothetical protein
MRTRSRPAPPVEFIAPCVDDGLAVDVIEGSQYSIPDLLFGRDADLTLRGALGSPRKSPSSVSDFSARGGLDRIDALSRPFALVGLG